MTRRSTAGGRRLIGVDVGGTFTDVMAVEDGRVIAAKVPTDPRASETSVLAAAELVEVSRGAAFNLTSTAGLNAIITRRLPKVGLLTTLGHRDVLDRGRLWRPFEALTDASWRRPGGDGSRPLVPRYLRRTVRERLTSDGAELVALDERQARGELELLRECGVAGVAICLLHAYRNPEHELRLAELAAEVLGDVTISVSSQVCPLAGEYERTTTTVVDLLMKLKYTDYTHRLTAGLDALGFRGQFNYADCSAMLIPAAYAMQRPYQLVVGGPAAGTVASAHFGGYLGESNLLCADVGGTSCDISLVLDGTPWVNDSFELEWDLVVKALSTEIVTLGAGGGSVVSIGKTGELRVGPDSAGAEPGPACYGKGGTAPTVTDAALSIGILAPDGFAGGRVPLFPDLATAAFERLDTRLPLAERVRQAWLTGQHHVAEGLLDIAVRHGIDVRDFHLMAFGAAGPMLLPGLLDLLPVKGVVVPPNPGGFSALGLLSSDQVFSGTRTLYGVLDPQLAPDIDALLTSLEESLLEASGAAPGEARVIRSFDGRLRGQGWETPFVPIPPGPVDIAAMTAAFHAEYERRNKHRFETFPVEGVTYRVQVVVPADKVSYPELPARAGSAPVPDDRVKLSHLYGDVREADCYERAGLRAGDTFTGPAIVREENSTTFVPAGHRAIVGRYGELTIS